MSILVQYVLTIWLPFVSDSWKVNFASLFSGHEVAQLNWQQWFALTKYKNLLFDTVLLISSYLVQRCTSGDILLKERRLPRHGDSEDFEETKLFSA